MLINEHPELALTIKKKLKYFVRKAEKKYNATKGSYWYRFFRPNDTDIGGTKYQYYATMTDATEMHLLAQATAFTIPTAEAYAAFGWYVDGDLGQDGYLLYKKQEREKWELNGRIPYEQKNPDHLYIDFDHVMYGEHKELLDFITYSALGVNQILVSIPVLFRIARKSSLGLLKN